MDDSWRMQMGISSSTHNRYQSLGNALETLKADDFADVFGGPPRTFLRRNFSVDFTHSPSFYEEIFPKPEFDSPVHYRGWRLPPFRSRSKVDGFSRNVFGKDDDWERSQARSKGKPVSDSSSFLSSEGLRPFRPVIKEDVELSSFAVKLRPINVPSRRNLSTLYQGENPKEYGIPLFPQKDSSFEENPFLENEFQGNASAFHRGLSGPAASPETVSLEPDSCASLKISPNNPELNLNSLSQEFKFLEDEVASSYVIKTSCSKQRDRSRSCEDVSIDEAIAWARAKSGI